MQQNSIVVISPARKRLISPLIPFCMFCTDEDSSDSCAAKPDG